MRLVNGHFSRLTVLKYLIWIETGLLCLALIGSLY